MCPLQMWQLKEHLRRVVGQHLGAPSSFMNGPSDEMKKIIVALTLQVGQSQPTSTHNCMLCLGLLDLSSQSMKSPSTCFFCQKVGELEAEVTSLRDERAAMLTARRSSAEQPAEIASPAVDSALAEEKVGPIRPQLLSSICSEGGKCRSVQGGVGERSCFFFSMGYLN